MEISILCDRLSISKFINNFLIDNHLAFFMDANFNTHGIFHGSNLNLAPYANCDLLLHMGDKSKIAALVSANIKPFVQDKLDFIYFKQLYFGDNKISESIFAWNPSQSEEVKILGKKFIREVKANFKQGVEVIDAKHNYLNKRLLKTFWANTILMNNYILLDWEGAVRLRPIGAT